jgi:hypothetical protein
LANDVGKESFVCSLMPITKLQLPEELAGMICLKLPVLIVGSVYTEQRIIGAIHTINVSDDPEGGVGAAQACYPRR